MHGEDDGGLRRAILWLVFGSFGVEMLLAGAWLHIARGSGLSIILLGSGEPGRAEVAGVSLGLLVALFSRWFFATFAHDLIEEFFIPTLGRLTYADAALLAVLPAIGEETLFRGTIQPELGLAVTSLVFGAMHSGFSRPLLPYGLWAASVGALLGLLYLGTGNIWAPITAHALVNAAGILWLKWLAARTPSEP